MSVPKASRLKTYSVLCFGRLHQERMTAKFLAFLSVEGNYQNIKTVRKKNIPVNCISTGRSAGKDFEGRKWCIWLPTEEVSRGA